MGHTYFSFNGRINAPTFVKAALMLVAIGIVISLAGTRIPQNFAPLLTVLSMVLYWPWVAIWVKRYHDADKSGWMVLVPILVFIVLSTAVTVYFMNKGLAVAHMTFMDLAEPANKAKFEAAMKGQQMAMLPLMVAVQMIVIFGFNAIIKSDPEENRFGHPVS